MKKRRGVALMIALLLIVTLGAIATQVTRSAYSVSDTADNLRSRAIARYAAESGIVLATSRVEETLRRMSDSTLIKRYLNGLEKGSAGLSAEKLGDARFQFTIVDVNSRLDVNLATAQQLSVLFSAFATREESQKAAAAIRNRIEYGHAGDSIDDVSQGGISKPSFTRPLRSLEELTGIPGVSAGLATEAAPFLTVDGDGRINRVSASQRVIASAGGELRDMPSRLLFISRGWKDGRPLTFEIQAVYALEYGRLVLVSWRERDL